MKDRGISRRDFLKLANSVVLTVCGLLGLGGLVKFLDTQTDASPQTDFDLGPAEKIEPGSRTIHPEIPAMLIRDAQGFSAISLVCTHLGCTVENKPEGFICPCHGSHFDRLGKVIRGPAEKALQALKTEITSDGRLHILTE